MKELYFITVLGESYSNFEEYYSKEEIEIINKFFDDMSKHGVASYDIPCVEFEKRQWKNGFMRNIKIFMPSGKAKMTLWANTEDQADFEIKSLKRGTPYVIAYGIRYDLTDEEIRYLRNMQKIVGG